MTGGAHAESRNVYSVLGFEMRTCLPLVRVCKMRESTAAVKRDQDLINREQQRALDEMKRKAQYCFY